MDTASVGMQTLKEGKNTLTPDTYRVVLRTSTAITQEFGRNAEPWTTPQTQ